MNSLALAIEILKISVIIAVFLLFSMLVAFLKRDLVETIRNLYHKCFEIARNMLAIFISKISHFHQTLTQEYLEKYDFDYGLVRIEESEQAKIRLVSNIDNTIESVDSFGNKVSAEIAEAVSQIDLRQVESLKANNSRLAESLNNILQLKPLDPIVGVSVKQKLLAAYILAFILLFFNTFLLAQFFRDIFMLNLPIIKYPIRIELAHPLAMIFGIVEMACGWIYSHQISKEQSEEFSPSTGAYKFWILLGFSFFIVVELYSFATLSARINIADILQISPESALYNISFYFMAFFGLGLGIIEFMMGLYMSELSEKRSLEKISRRSMKYVKQIKAHSQSVYRILEPLNDKISKYTEMIDDLPRRSGEVIKSLTGYSNDDSTIEKIVVQQLSDLKKEIVGGNHPDKTVTPPLKQLVYQKAFRDMGITIVWSILVFVVIRLLENNFLVPQPIAETEFKEYFSLFMSIFVLATLVLAGFSYQKVSMLVEIESGHKQLNLLKKITTLIVLALSIGLTTALIYFKNENTSLAFLLGVLLPLAVYFFSTLLYQAIPSISYCVQIGFFGLLWILQYLTRGIILYLVGVVSLIVNTCINIFSGPGVVILEKIRSRANA